MNNLLVEGSNLGISVLYRSVHFTQCLFISNSWKSKSSNSSAKGFKKQISAYFSYKNAHFNSSTNKGSEYLNLRNSNIPIRARSASVEKCGNCGDVRSRCILFFGSARYSRGEANPIINECHYRNLVAQA